MATSQAVTQRQLINELYDVWVGMISLAEQNKELRRAVEQLQQQLHEQQQPSQRQRLDTLLQGVDLAGDEDDAKRKRRRLDTLLEGVDLDE
jgi:hypothetical protein